MVVGAVVGVGVAVEIGVGVGKEGGAAGGVEARTGEVAVVLELVLVLVPV